jgi:hypothetical protein
MALFTQSNEISALRPGIHGWWGLGYDMIPEQYSQIFATLKSTLNYEKDVNMFGLGIAKVRPEGTATEYDTMGEGFNYVYYPVPFSMGATITHLAIINNQYMQVGEMHTKEIGRGMHEAKEIVCANIFNKATDSSLVYADGQPLLSQSHLLSGGGTYSNMLSINQDISEDALEQAVQQTRQYKDDRGKRILVECQKVIVHPNDEFEIQRILKSELRVGTADNDINVINAGRYFPKGFMVYRFLLNAGAWFVQTDIPQGLQYFQREELKIDMDHDFHTDNIFIKGYENWSVGCTNPMAVIGSPGE